MACPNCGNPEIMGGKTDLERVTLYDYFCPKCGTTEQADSSQPETLRAMRQRWEGSGAAAIPTTTNDK